MSQDRPQEGFFPPLLDEFGAGGKITWRHLEEIDIRRMGDVLSCHLILEHYIDSYLAHGSPNYLNWNKARLSFSQKLDLLSSPESPLIEVGIIEGARCLNKLRNKFAHSLEAEISSRDVEPLLRFPKRIAKDHELDDLTPEKTIQEFTGSACAWIAGNLSALAKMRQSNEDNSKKKKT